MKITAEHVQAFGYWRTPPALLALVPKMRRPDIDRLINAHAGIKDPDIGVNALHLLQLRRRNGDSALAALQPSEWDRAQKGSAKKRYFMFVRWRRALLKSIIQRTAHEK